MPSRDGSGEELNNSNLFESASNSPEGNVEKSKMKKWLFTVLFGLANFGTVCIVKGAKSVHREHF
jgi:hypothetical protein